jgi:outer membrane receptor protein involved in Fe transport
MKHLYQWLMMSALFCLSINVLAQNGTITGKISDAKSGEAVPFATISTATADGKLAAVQSDFDGNYSLSVAAGTYSVKANYVGYTELIKSVTLSGGQEVTLDFAIAEATQMLDDVVITGSKFEQKLGEQTVSLSVLKPNLVDGINSTSIDKAIEKTPGVDLIDGQANIRGGSGYSYGAGSRVLLLMDDMPIMNGDAGLPDWDFLPVENLEQIEIIKGASSALYGSSALNGVINMRTAYPKSQPETKFSSFATIYQNPKNNEVVRYLATDTAFTTPIDTVEKAWWKGQYIYESGASFAHKEKFKNFDLVAGAYIFAGDTWRQSSYSRRGRFNVNTRYRFPNKPGLSVGLNANIQLQTSGSFPIWNNLNRDTIPQGGVDGGAYQIWTATPAINNQSLALSIDPFLEHFSTATGIKHKLQGRFYRNDNQNDTKQGAASDLFYGEYQFQKRFENIKLVTTAGVVGNYVISNAELFQDTTKHSTNVAGYLQVDKKFFDKLNISLGARYEYNKVVDISEAKPVFRAGINYEAADYTFIRASWGQGYRFPTIAEKYVRTDLGAYPIAPGFGVQLGIFPNVNLKSETGWSAELGIKQGFKVGEWQGFLDASGFINEYNDMMEFTFGVNSTVNTIVNILGASLLSPDLYKFLTDTCAAGAGVQIPNDGELRAGFQSVNIGDTRILGGDISVAGQGKLGTLPTTVLLGYTYIDPKFQNFDCVQQALTSSPNNTLKYRFRHTVKGDIETTMKRVSVGLTVQYYSYMEAIDQAFNVLLPGIKEFRDNHNSGDLILDLRCGVKLGENSSLSLLVKNLLNTEYALRPALIDAPRNFTLRYAWSIKGKEKE